ncbi:ATPase components of ABC transporters with duplicated ATPase domains [Psychrobacillus psychrotolerans]|uniref:ATPase components of ABC transporters with duplicated ATPase domains n=1 Tax=Psychrobacillus psychrotolerans TaxID=126156 RepID=A0A1I5VBA4_9BACI|nr:ABC-F type ribosomal protection protein [Psychrobacillus psychrotolerans]SFQ04799.1 ATPase components of ABC transporters with duplicated ATPase domains [Psychrobacillus psychrotolerans]
MICTVQNITKMLGGNIIFEKLSLAIKTGERLAIVGRNGSGKTTLFKLLAGNEKPDEGSIHFKKGTSVGYLAQIPSYSEDVTGLDVLHYAFEKITALQQKMIQMEKQMATIGAAEMERLLQQYGEVQEQFTLLGGYTMESEIEKVVQGLQLTRFINQPFASLSGGEQTKIMLGKILLSDPDVLLLDEPTNHLDLFAVEWLEQYLIGYSGTVVIISHDRYFLDQVVTKIADLEEGELSLYHGDYSAFILEKEAKLIREFQHYEEQQKKIKKMKDAIRRLRQWANEAVPPNPKLFRQARNMERALERMVKVRKPLIDPKKMELSFEFASRSGKEVVMMKNVYKSFGENVLLEDAQLNLYWKERVAIVGRNGSGKSTILHLLLGNLPIDNGVARLGSNVRVGYLSQHFEIQNPKARLIDVFRSELNLVEGDARHILAKFMFFGPDVFKRIGDLSGGERMRLRLAQLMHQDINLLILDEPTNHLDIESREVLEDALGDFDGTILAVSHDRYFLNKLFPKTVWLEQGQLTTFEGSYDWARIKWEEQVPIEIPFKNEKQEKPTYKRSAGGSVERKIEEEIQAVEKEISNLKEQIEIEEDWETYEKLLKAIESNEMKIEKLTLEWIEQEDDSNCI